MYNLPNILTLSRIAVIPLIFVSIYIHSFWWAMFAGALFIAASITDYLDGYLARARNETSSFGRLLDPIADKLLVATALVVIITKTYYDDDGVFRHYYIWNGTIFAAFVILCREILVSGLREFLREVNVGLPVTKLAKWKTGFQMTALSMMLFCELSLFWGYLGEFLLWVAAVLTFITGYQYYQKSLDYVKAEEAQKMMAAIKNVAVKVVKTAAEKIRVATDKKSVAAKAAAVEKTAAPKKSVATKAAVKAPKKSPAKKAAPKKSAAKTAKKATPAKAKTAVKAKAAK